MNYNAEKKCPEESVDMSREMQRLFKEKQKMRAEATEYFMKTVYNPYRSISAGPPFDPNVQRFSAMSAYRAEYFKPSKSAVTGLLCLLFGPMAGMYALLTHTRSKKEEKIRSGLVPYEERDYQLI